MLTMPIAGMYADKKGPGKVVLVGLTLVGLGMAAFTRLGADTSYWFLLSALSVMGMGCTMMPTFSAALSTLTDHLIARGSTMVNITQRVASSIGFAVFSVLLTNTMKNHESLVIGQALEEAGGDRPRAARSWPSTG